MSEKIVQLNEEVIKKLVRGSVARQNWTTTVVTWSPQMFSKALSACSSAWSIL